MAESKVVELNAEQHKHWLFATEITEEFGYIDLTRDRRRLAADNVMPQNLEELVTAGVFVKDGAWYREREGIEVARKQIVWSGSTSEIDESKPKGTNQSANGGMSANSNTIIPKKTTLKPKVLEEGETKHSSALDGFNIEHLDDFPYVQDEHFPEVKFEEKIAYSEDELRLGFKAIRYILSENSTWVSHAVGSRLPTSLVRAVKLKGWVRGNNVSVRLPPIERGFCPGEEHTIPFTDMLKIVKRLEATARNRLTSCQKFAGGDYVLKIKFFKAFSIGLVKKNRSNNYHLPAQEETVALLRAAAVRDGAEALIKDR